MAAGAVAAARGALLGLVLGDAVGAIAGLVPDSGPLRATTGGQLACFTVDGLIRADVASALSGDGHPPRQVWRAYARWAAIQGELPDDADADGWLADVAPLRERRGAAPATVAALQERNPETRVDNPGPTEAERPAGPLPASGRTADAGDLRSLGPRAVTRSLPVGLYARAGQAAHLAAEIASLTHRGPAVVAAAVGAMTLQLLSEGAAVGTAVATAAEQANRLGQGGVPEGVTAAVTAGQTTPRESAHLAGFAADTAAASVLAGALYVAASFPDPEDVRDALVFAASAGDGGHVATITGALLGAAHGPDALPVGWLSRLELVWVADTLARDLVRQLSESPAGTEYTEPTDPHWWRRYPGW